MHYLDIHNEAKIRVKNYQDSVYSFLEILEKIQDERVFQHLSYPSLWSYCTTGLALSESDTHRFISVMRKAKEIPELKAAVKAGELSLPKAARIAPLMTRANHAEWICEAKTLTTRELEKKIVTHFPQAVCKERVTAKTTQVSELRIALSGQTLAYLQTAKNILSGKLKKIACTEETLCTALREYIEKHSSLEKAKRANRRRSLSALKVASEKTRNPSLQLPKTEASTPERSSPRSKPVSEVNGTLTRKISRPALCAEIKHSVALRDHRRCTALLPDGKRCPEERFLQLHHILPRSHGGKDTLCNLKTVCFTHHRRIHSK